MLEPAADDTEAFATVEERLLRQAVERLKTRLPVEVARCGECGFTGEAFRWGIKTRPAAQAQHVELVLCCPSCERPTDLEAVGADTGYRG